MFASQAEVNNLVAADTATSTPEKKNAVPQARDGIF